RDGPRQRCGRGRHSDPGAAEPPGTDRPATSRAGRLPRGRYRKGPETDGLAEGTDRRHRGGAVLRSAGVVARRSRSGRPVGGPRAETADREPTNPGGTDEAADEA